MSKFNIGTLNNISDKGLSKFNDNYDLIDDIDKANGIIVRSYKMHDMGLSENLLAIARAGAGVNNIPIDRCSEKGIVVFNTPGANANAVKELVIAGMIMSARNMYESISWGQTLEGDVTNTVEKGKKQFAGIEILGKTLGVIGLGAIGSRIANAASSLGMTVVGYEPFEPNTCLTAPVEIYKNLDEMLGICDFVSIHVPSLPDTLGMVNKDFIDKMKDGAVLINYSRAELVIPNDIIEAVCSGKLHKYITDLLEPEFIGKKGIVATTHIGASTIEAEENCAVMAANQLMEYLENGNITNSVNFPSLSLENKPGTKKHCITICNDKDLEMLKSKLSEFYGDSLLEIVGAQKGEVGYFILRVKEDCEKIFNCTCVVRNRVV
ncbi:MAG: 3-phosphoglycerate dehydrogenase [Clostridiales bacterium]|nr:3-phosphoglycerate dehydrogenase [Clostridiales bacterium]